MIAIDLSRQQVLLDADPREIQQIHFTANLITITIQLQFSFNNFFSLK